MTTTDDPTTDRETVDLNALQGPLEQAKAALAYVGRLAALDGEERIEAVARGFEVGKAQRAYLAYAQAHAAVALADSLERLLDLLERRK